MSERKSDGGLPSNTIDWQFHRADAEDMLEVVIHYDIDPYVPACVSGPADNWYPAEGGCVTDLIATKPGTAEVIELTVEERDEVAEWIERNHDHNADMYGDPDRAYDERVDREAEREINGRDLNLEDW